MGSTCSVDETEVLSSDLVVKKKLLRSTRYKHQFDNNVALLNELVVALSTTEGLKSKYLTTNWMKTMEMCQLIEDQVPRKGFKQMFQSQSEAVTFQSQPHEQDDTSDVSIDEMSEFMRRIDNMYDENSRVKIKLVVTEVPLTDTMKNFRMLISPVMSQFPTFPEYGMFHCALVVGPWYIDWNNQELCVPRKCVSNASFLSTDLDELTTLESLQDCIDKLSGVIVRWNTTMSYVKSSGVKGVSGNCQDFVDELLEALEIRPKFSGPMAAFLKRLKRKGVCDLQFRMSESFRRKFSITEEKMVFTSHEQLDKFVERLLIVDPEFDAVHKEEWVLLKAFDRGFWLRHFHQDQDVRFKPYCRPCLEDEETETEAEIERACPFRDPRETYSFRFIRDSSTTNLAKPSN